MPTHDWYNGYRYCHCQYCTALLIVFLVAGSLKWLFSLLSAVHAVESKSFSLQILIHTLLSLLKHTVNCF